MLLAADPVGDFIHKNPTVVMLALGFLLMIGMVLIAEGFDVEVPKGYVYFAMGFAIFVELMNMRLRKVREKAVRLHEPYSEKADGGNGRS
jgi:predicted tellurium resistance membrane protein TerC